ncbi:MAG: uroporphyrinogen-III synthase [Planctomycetes bacterium]|nr:uroporphyrinogen-III synthase [Planctomycetota bacterium]
MGDETPGILDGRSIAITREQPGELARLLFNEGAHVLHFPLIRVVASNDPDLAAALMQDFDWVVFTSVNAVLFTGELLRSGNRKLSASVACVGSTTAAEAARLGLTVDMVPEKQHVKGLIEAFAALDRRGGRVLYPRSELAASTLKEGLQALGFVVDDPVAYRTLPDEEGMKGLQLQYGLEAIVFASPSAVKHAVAAVGTRLATLRLYSIGPTTSAAIRACGLQVAGEAREHSAEGLLGAIIKGETTR